MQEEVERGKNAKMGAATSYIAYYCLGTSNENSHDTLTLLVDKLAFALLRFFPELDHLEGTCKEA